MSDLWRLRLARSNDLPALSGLLAAADLDLIDATDGNTDEQLMIALSLDSLGQEAALLGCIRIRRDIGLAQPRYWYHLGTVVHAAPDLGLFHRQRTLLIGNDHTGATELSDLAVDNRYLDPQKCTALIHCLVRAAVQLLLQPADAAASITRVIAALPGLRDADGASPFWQGLGRHFYGGDVAEAAQRFGSAWITHAAALLPRHPLVASLLQADAQAAIGCISQDAGALRDALTEAGFRAGQHLSLFDAGPIFEAQLADLPAAKHWRSVTVRVANTQGAEYAADAQLERSTQGLLKAGLLKAGLLKAENSEVFWYVPLTQNASTVSISAATSKAIDAATGTRLWLWSGEAAGVI